MADRLAAGARRVHVGGLRRAQDRESAAGEAFGGDVDVGAGEGGGGGEEDGLGEDPFVEVVGDGVPELDHSGFGLTVSGDFWRVGWWLRLGLWGIRYLNETERES